MLVKSTPRKLPVLLVLALLALVAAALWSRAGTGDNQRQPAVYVALGASDAVGVGADRPEFESWPAYVHARLPEGTRLVNLGISGATLSDVLRYELPPALDAQPRLVSIWPGVNDLRAGVSLDTFTAQLDTLLSHFSAAEHGEGRPAPTLVVLSIPDLRQVPAFADADRQALNATVQRWNAAISDVARKHNAVMVDLYTHGLDVADQPELVSADGFHPSSSGYQRIADMVLVAMSQHNVSANP